MAVLDLEFDPQAYGAQMKIGFSTRLNLKTILSLLGILLSLTLYSELGRLGYANEKLPPYTCAFDDGSWYSGSRLSSWNKPDREPTLDGKKLFSTKKQIVWFKNNQIEEPQTPLSYIELYGGDILPGRVIEQRQVGGRAESVLVVDPAFSFSLPNSEQKSIRVKESWVQRIVEAADREYSRLEPNTLRTRDGKNINARSLRWRDGGIEALTESGLEKFELSNLQEVHYSQRKPWEVYIDLLAGLSPSADARIFRVETSGGVKLTSTTDRFLPDVRGGNSNKEDNWFHLLQPVWSLDPIWVKHIEIYKRQYFEPEEPPLSFFEVENVLYRQPLGVIFPLKINSNVLGGILQSQDQDFGWGFGVHAETSMTFSFPEEAIALQSRFSLDPSVGQGGCVQVFILDGLGKELYQSPIVVGSEKTYDTQWVQFGQTVGNKKITLVCDAVLGDRRPSGADPLDIRDHLNWLEPKVKLDPFILNKKIQSRVEQFIPAWVGWNVVGSKGYSFKRDNFLDRHNYKAPHFRQAVHPRPPFLRLERPIQVKDEKSRIELFVGKPSHSYWNVQFIVQVENEKPRVYTVPNWNSQHRHPPLIVPLGQFAGKEVNVKITQLEKGPTARVHWDDIQIH